MNITDGKSAFEKSPSVGKSLWCLPSPSLNTSKGWQEKQCLDLLEIPTHEGGEKKKIREAKKKLFTFQVIHVAVECRARDHSRMSTQVVLCPKYVASHLWHHNPTAASPCSPVRCPLSSPRSNHPQSSDNGMLWLTPFQRAPDGDLCRPWTRCSTCAGLKRNSSQEDRQKSRSLSAETAMLKVMDHACSFNTSPSDCSWWPGEEGPAGHQHCGAV